MLPIKKIFAFLSELSSNNHKEWFDNNRDRYEQIKKSSVDFSIKMIKSLSNIDATLSDLEPKDCMFRINRDVRFSPNKEPYKKNIAFSFTQGGKKSTYAGFYIHVQPNNESFMAGGLYMPMADILKKVRNEIEYRPTEFEKTITGKDFLKYFGTLTGDKLSKPPKGFAANHPQIEYLKHKSFLAWHKISDKDMLDIDLEKYSLSVFKAMYPFNNFLNQAINFEE